MSDDIIVTQHFDDPVGSVIEIDGQCYVKVSDKSDTITRYLTDADTKTYHSDCSDCSNQVNGTVLCPPGIGTELYTIGYITGSIRLSASEIGVVPTDKSYNASGYTISFISATCNVIDVDNNDIESDSRPYSDRAGIYTGKASIDYVTTRVTLRDPNYIHPWL